MACTQVLDDSTYAPAVIVGKVKAGVLFVNGLRHDIFCGENVIGRDEQCDIVISSAAISTKHAVIEIEDLETHLIYDTGSTNKTRLRKFVMKPHVRYNLQNGDEIMFANVKATYTKWSETICDSDAGSETGSESEINFNDDTLFSKDGRSKTDVETLCGSIIIDETKAENDTVISTNKSIKSPNTSELKSDNDSALCTSGGSSSYTPLFQRVKNIGNMLTYDKNRPDKTVNDTVEDISMLSVGAPNSNSRQILEVSKVSEIPESDDDEEEDDDFCILSQKTRSAQKKKRVTNEYTAQQNVFNKSFENDSTDFFNETDVFRTGSMSVAPGPSSSSVSLVLQPHTKSNVNFEELSQDISQCESQSLLTECSSNVPNITHTNDKNVDDATDNNETQAPLNRTTVSVNKTEEDETQVHNKSNKTSNSIMDIDETQVANKTVVTVDNSSTVADMNDEFESQSLLAENVEPVLNKTQVTVSHSGKKLDNLKRDSHDKTDIDNKTISIFELDTQLPEDLDNSIKIIYDTETQALVNRHKSRFGNKLSTVRSKLKVTEKQGQVNSFKGISETHHRQGEILSHSGGHSLSAIHESVAENSEGNSIFDVDTQLPEDLEATCIPKVQEQTMTKNQDHEDNSIFDIDTQLPEDFEDVPNPQIQGNIATKNQVSVDKPSKDETNGYTKQDNRSDNSIFECNTQPRFDIDTDNMYDMDTQLLIYPNKNNASELKLSGKSATKECDISNIENKESNLNSTNKLDMRTSSENKYSVIENLTDSFKIPVSTKRVSLSNKKRGIKLPSENHESSVIEENSQESECRKSLFKDKIEKPLFSSNQETISQADKNLTEMKLPLEEEVDISDELTQKLNIPSKNIISTKIEDMANIQNCVEQDMSDELTQKISFSKWQTSIVSDKLLRAVGNVHTGRREVNDVVGANKCNEEEGISDELTQKLPTSKLKKLPSTSDTSVEKGSVKYMDTTGKVDMTKYDEDMSDELTQKISSVIISKTTSMSDDVLLERYKNHNSNKIDTSKHDGENMSDELTQKIVIPVGKCVPSMPSKMLEMPSRNHQEKQANKIQKCSEDISDELTEKIEIIESKRATSVSKEESENLSKNTKQGNERNEDLSDELTQKIIVTSKGKHILPASNRLLETGSKYQEMRRRTCNEDLSDEPTQKIVTSTSKCILSGSSSLVKTGSKNRKEQVTVVLEDISDELTQKIMTPKSKYTHSVPCKVVESLSENQKEDAKKYDKDLSDELTQKIVTPEGKRVLSGFNKFLVTGSKNQKEQARLIEEDISDEVTQKIIIPDSKKARMFSGRNLETSPKERLDLANNAVDLYGEDISDELTQKISMPKGKAGLRVSNKLLEFVNRNKTNQENKNEQDLSEEPTQKIVTPVGKQTPCVYSKSTGLLNKTRLEQGTKPGKCKKEKSDALRNKIVTLIDKQIPSTSHEQTEIFDSKQSNRREDDECDLSGKRPQKTPNLRNKHVSNTSNIVESNLAEATSKRDSLTETSSKLSTQEKSVRKSKRNANVKIVVEDKVNGFEGFSSKRKKQTSVSKLDLIDDTDLSDKRTHKHPSSKVKLVSSESDRKQNKVQNDKGKDTVVSKHEDVQKRSTRKRANMAERHEIKSCHVSQLPVETITNLPSQKDVKPSRKLVVSLDRVEVKSKMESGEKYMSNSSSVCKNKLDVKKADVSFSDSNKKQTNPTDICNPLKGSNAAVENKKIINTTCIFDDSDSDITDLEEIFVEDEVKKFKERKISDYFKKFSSDEETKMTRHPAKLVLKKYSNNTTPTKESERCRLQSDTPSPFVLPSVSNIKRAENEYYETLSPVKIPDHIRSIDEKICDTSSTRQRRHRVRRNIKKELQHNKSSERSEVQNKKSSNKRGNKTKSDNSCKSNKQETHVIVEKSSTNSTLQERENTTATDMLSKSDTSSRETKSRSTAKNNSSTHTALSDKSNALRTSKRKHKKQQNDMRPTVENDKIKTASKDRLGNSDLIKSDKHSDKSSGNDKIATRSNSKELAQKESKKDRNKRSPDVSTESKPKAAKFLKTEEAKLQSYESPVSDQHAGTVGTSRRVVTRQMNKGKDGEKNYIKSNALNQLEIYKNRDNFLKTEIDLDTSDKTRRKRKLESSALTKDVSDSKIKKLVVNGADTESSSTGIKIVIRRNQNENNTSFSVSRLSKSGDSNKTREADTSINYDDIIDVASNSDSINGLESGRGTTDCYYIRKSKRLLKNKTSAAVKSVVSDDNSSRRHSPRISGSKIPLNDMERKQNDVQENPVTSQIQFSNRRSHSHTCERVLFTGMSDPNLDTVIKELGGTIADSPQDCTVLVTDKVRRTVKMLCAVAQGKPIVSPIWIVKSKAAGHFLNPWQHLIVDREAEKKYNFQLHKVLTECKQHCTLEGYSVYITSSVNQPSIPEVRTIIESCRAKVLEKVPSKWPEKSFVISCIEDKSVWKKLERKSVLPPVVASETLLSGIFNNHINFNYHRLS